MGPDGKQQAFAGRWRLVLHQLPRKRGWDHNPRCPWRPSLSLVRPGIGWIYRRGDDRGNRDLYIPRPTTPGPDYRQKNHAAITACHYNPCLGCFRNQALRKKCIVTSICQKWTWWSILFQFCRYSAIHFLSWWFCFAGWNCKFKWQKNPFFDEIQLVTGWEFYVRQKLDQNRRVINTGSNARMLSVELGTNLTGRHISKELFPFSFREFCLLKNLNLNTELYRDIATRYAIRDINGLKNLCVFLFSVAAKQISPSKLTHVIGVKSPSTVLEYLSYFKSSYVINLIPKFS